MKDLTVIVHDDYIDRVVESLHENGLAEISDVERDEKVGNLVETVGISESISKFTRYEMKVSSVLDVFQKVSDEESAISQFLNPKMIEKAKIKKRDLDDLFSEIDSKMDEVGKKVNKYDEKLVENDEKIKDLKFLKKDLELIESIDIDLSFIGESTYAIFKIGTTKNPYKAKKALSDVDGSYFFSKKVDEERYVIITGVFIKQKMEFESALRQGDVKPLDFKQLDSGKPREALNMVEKELKNLKNKKNLLIEEIKGLKDNWHKDFMVLREELEVYREKYEVLQEFGKTDHTSVIKGWVKESDKEAVKDLVDESSDGYSTVVVEEPESTDDVPVSLNNPTWLKPFEMLTNMFAPPKYDEIDPTFVIGPAFVLFFGLMLGDVIYGLLIVITSILLLRGLGKIEEGTRRFALVLLSVGLSTTIFGILQGGYLGPDRDTHPNLIGRLGLTWFFEDITQIDTLAGDGPQILLIVSLLIGLAYLNIGIFLSFIQHVRRGNKKEIVLDNISWWLLQPGGFILISSNLFGWYTFSGEIYIIAWTMSILGLGLLFLKAKGLSFFDLTGFIGDFLSFARILALGLATAGIALTVNVLADMVSSAEMGMILAVPLMIGGVVVVIKGFSDKNITFQGLGGFLLLTGGLAFVNPAYPFYMLGLIIMIGGHLANASLQALGAFVHSLRLQYVEFLGQFYEGGGKPYSPFKAKREYTQLDEDVVK
ncbi:MAG: V-type ATP synthase subunit I [Candidatus Saliniplasma sp.]